MFKEEEKGNNNKDNKEEFKSIELNTLSYVIDRQSIYSSCTT